MTPAELSRIEALAAAATAVPWTSSPAAYNGHEVTEADSTQIAHCCDKTLWHGKQYSTERVSKANAAFIAAARADVPALAAEVRAAWALVLAERERVAVLSRREAGLMAEVEKLRAELKALDARPTTT